MLDFVHVCLSRGWLYRYSLGSLESVAFSGYHFITSFLGALSFPKPVSSSFVSLSNFLHFPGLLLHPSQKLPALVFTSNNYADSDGKAARTTASSWKKWVSLYSKCALISNLSLFYDTFFSPGNLLAEVVSECTVWSISHYYLMSWVWQTWQILSLDQFHYYMMV